MHIAFVSQYFHPEQFSNNQIVEFLTARGNTVDVICSVPNYGQDSFFDGYSNTKLREEVWNGARVHRALTVSRGRSKLRLFLNYLSFPIFGSWTAWRTFRNFGRPDVSFVSMPSPIFQAIVGLAIKARYGTPTVFWVQDIWPESLLRTLNIKSKFIEKIAFSVCGFLYRRADFVLVQSAALPSMILRFGVAENRIGVLPNTAPESYRPIQPSFAPEEQNLMAKGKFKVVFAGNIGQSQDFDTVLAAAVLLRDISDLHWYIIGSGRDLERVVKRVSELRLDTHFTFLGRFPEERMPYFFSHADALMVSLIDNDIFRLTVPYKVQCYLACGKPIAALLSGEGARVLSESDAGKVAPAGDAQKFAAAVRELVEMTGVERDKMGQNARALFEKSYSQEVILESLHNVLKVQAKR